MSKPAVVDGSLSGSGSNTFGFGSADGSSSTRNASGTVRDEEQQRNTQIENDAVQDETGFHTVEIVQNDDHGDTSQDEVEFQTAESGQDYDHDKPLIERFCRKTESRNNQGFSGVST